MKAIFLMGLLVLSSSAFSKVEPDESSDLPVAPLVAPEPKEEPKVEPADTPKPSPFMEKEIQKVAAKQLKEKEALEAALKKKYAKSPPKVAEREMEIAKIQLEFKQQRAWRTQMCEKFPKEKEICALYKKQIEAMKPTEEAQIQEKKAAFDLALKQDEGKLDALAADCFKLQKQEQCQQLSAANKEHEKQFGEIYFTEDEVAAYNKPKFDAKKCQWSFDLPRRIISRPGCGQGKSMQTCVGYVICDPPEGTIKVVRMSTCSPENCGDNDASKCTQEQGFSSKNKTEFFDTASDKVKTAIGAGAVSQ